MATYTITLNERTSSGKAEGSGCTDAQGIAQGKDQLSAFAGGQVGRAH